MICGNCAEYGGGCFGAMLLDGKNGLGGIGKGDTLCCLDGMACRGVELMSTASAPSRMISLLSNERISPRAPFEVLLRMRLSKCRRCMAMNVRMRFSAV